MTEIESDTGNTETWPIRESDTVVVHRQADTLAGGAPPPPVAPVPPPPGPAPDRRIGAGMLLAIAVILLAVAGAAIAYFLTHRDTTKQVTTVVVRTNTPGAATPKVTVPKLVGMKEPVALVRLTQLGLRPKEVYRPTRKPQGVVVSQRPQQASRLAKGSQVTLVIDSGAPTVSVPDVSGKSLADAQAALDKLGLDSTVTQVSSSDTAAGTIVDQAPKSGAKLAKGSMVTLSVAKQSGAQPQTTSTGTATTTTAQTTTAQTTTSSAPPAPQTATMPDVTNQTEASAAQALSKAGILASLFFVPGSDPLGTVEQQAKSAGTTMPYHSHVQINISSGPGDKPSEDVPTVVGQTLTQAVASLNAAHLRLIYVKFPVTSRSQAGKIVQQSPLGGGHAPQNAQVLVFVGALQK